MVPARWPLGGSNSYSGTTSVNGGVLNLANSAALAGGGNVTFGGGTLQFTSSNTTDYSPQIVNSTGPISLDTNGQTVTFAGSMGSSNTDGLYLTDSMGGGTLILGAAADNEYLGNTEVNAGTLEVLGSAALPYETGLIVNANGTVEIGDPAGAGRDVAVTSSFAVPHAGGVAAVPEPGTLALLAVAALLAAAAWRRRKGF